jgi:hypothetical protein
MASKSEILNDLLQQSDGASHAREILATASLSMLRVLADLNHIDPQHGRKVLTHRLVTEVHGDRPVVMSDLWVCPTCMLMHANGVDIRTESHAGDPSEPAPFALWEGHYHRIAMGGEHAEECPNGPDGPRDSDCDCETREYSSRSCDGCGSHLHGTRYAFTLFDR